MRKIIKGLCVAVLLLGTACGSPDADGETAGDAEMKIVTEADSLSVELSAAGDSVEMKVKALQASLDSLNN